MRPRFDDARDVDDVARTALVRALEIMETRKGNVQLVHWENGSTLHIVAQNGFGDEFLTVFKEVTLQHGSVCSRALLRRQTVVVEDVETDLDFAPYREVARRAGFRSVQSTPLLSSGGSLVGIVSTHGERPGHPSDQQLAKIKSLARTAADAIIAIRAKGRAVEVGLTIHRSQADWLKAHGAGAV
jgi:GAF domain-containing protein